MRSWPFRPPLLTTRIERIGAHGGRCRRCPSAWGASAQNVARVGLGDEAVRVRGEQEALRDQPIGARANLGDVPGVVAVALLQRRPRIPGGLSLRQGPPEGKEGPVQLADL